MGFFSKLFSKNNDWTRNELAAVVRSLEALANSDGNYDNKEYEYIIDKMNELNTIPWNSQTEIKSFQDKMKSLDTDDLIVILGAMTDDKKRILADAFSELTLIDGDLSSEELFFQKVFLETIGFKGF